MSIRIISPLIPFVGIAVSAALVLPPSSSYSQYASSNNPKANQLYIVCSLVDDPHKTVYYSGIFRGLDPSIHIYEKSFSTHLEMSRTTVIGTAKCSSYQSEGAAKAGLANLQENWQWIYKTSVQTGWSYTPISRYGQP